LINQLPERVNAEVVAIAPSADVFDEPALEMRKRVLVILIFHAVREIERDAAELTFKEFFAYRKNIFFRFIFYAPEKRGRQFSDVAGIFAI